MKIFDSKKQELENYEFDFGDLSKNSQAKETLLIEGEDLTGFVATAKCGCTITEPKINNDGSVSLEVSYTHTHLIGDFVKSIVLDYREEGIKGSAVLKIKGKVN